MRYATVCSGIEAPSCAWHPLGWRPVFFSEIEKFPCAVLEQRWPGVPNLGDMTRFAEWPDADFDVLCGGTPCQSFSVAGLRKGLDDPRGNLMLTYLAIAARYRPRWLVWENVPGVLSIDGGRAFGTLLGGLGQLGYGFAHRILDAQFAGLAQRRERVFVVGCRGDWRGAAAVFLECASVRGDPAPRRKARQGATASAARSVAIRGRDGIPQAELGDDKANAILTPNGGRGGIGVGAVLAPEIARCIATREGTSQDYETTTMVAHSLRGEGFDASEDGTGRGTPLVTVDVMPTMLNGANTPAGHNARSGHSKDAYVVPIAYGLRNDASREGKAKTPSADAEGRVRLRDPGFNVYEEHAPTLDAGAPHSVAETVRSHPRPGSNSLGNIAFEAMRVRRLTPRECERLQGFPDDYTLIEFNRKPAKDGPRYKALGNSMAVPVVRWIGQRIQQVDQIMSTSVLDQ